ncbi:MAG: hypothetical protein V7L04_08325 [Nostoc sp.]|uniref:hypothetical protein n=1 Tax=Nostoc sp. TaxID=1180 RepID=UPI002FF51801
MSVRVGSGTEVETPQPGYILCHKSPKSTLLSEGDEEINQCPMPNAQCPMPNAQYPK